MKKIELGNIIKAKSVWVLLLMVLMWAGNPGNAQAQDDLKKQLKKQNKVAGTNDGSAKADKYDEIKSDKKREKFLRDSKRKKAKNSQISSQPTQLEVRPSAPPAKNPKKTRAEAAKKNRTVGTVKDVPDGQRRNSTVFKATDPKTTSINNKPTEFKASSGGPPPVDKKKYRSNAAKKNRNVGAVKDMTDGQMRNSTEFKASSGTPPPVDKKKYRSEAAKKNRNVGAVKDMTDGQMRNSTQFSGSTSAPPPVDKKKYRSEAAKKNRNVGAVKDMTDGQMRNSTQFSGSTSAPPPVDKKKYRSEAVKKNRTVGAVKDMTDGQMRNSTEFSGSTSAPPPVDRQKYRSQAERKNRTVGAVQDMTDNQMRNPTQFSGSTSAPPRVDRQKYRSEALKKSKTVGMIKDWKDDDIRNPTQFKSSPYERIDGPSPQTRKAELLKEMDRNSGDIKQSTREDWIQRRQYKSSQAGNYEGSIKMSDVNARSKNKENLRKDMEEYGTGDIPVGTREDQYAIRKRKSEESANYTGGVKMSVVEARNKQREDLKKDMEKYGTGDISIKTRENQYAIRRQKSEETANYTGSVKMSVMDARNKKREDLKKDMEKYGTGDISIKTRENQYAIRRQKSEETANYTGSVKMSVVEARAKKKEALRKEMSKYSTGDISLRDLDKRAKARRVKDREMASYQGTFKIRDIEKHQKNIRRKAADIANFRGDIKIQRRMKGVHPSVMYRQGWNNDRKKRDKLRRKMLKKSRRKGDIEMPAYQKNKLPKPGYDPREAEIWYK